MSGEVDLQEIAGPNETKLNVIFVHGLGGDAKGTWTFDETPLHAKVSGKLSQLLPNFLRGEPRLKEPTEVAFWPEWLAQDVDGLAVYSLDYPSDPKRWRAGWSVTKSAVAILDALMVDRRLRGNGAPIVFVCHSLGGLVVKKLIVTANIDKGQEPKKGTFLDRIVGVAFLATPHQGAFLATFLTEFGWMAASESLRDLQANSDALLDMGNSYRSMIEDEGRRIEHCVYYEDEKVAGLKIVNAGSANPGLTGVRPVAVLRDHLCVCKMQKKDQVYNGVLALLEEALKPRPDPSRKVLEEAKTAAEAAKENTEAISQQQKSDSATLNEIKELLALAHQSGAAQRAIDQGISEAALRAVVERLGGEGLLRDDLIPWLDQWTAAAARELRDGANEGEAFDRAFAKARELFNAGRIAEASQPFMEELERRRKAEEQRREEEKLSQLRLVEEAIKYDKLALNGEAAAKKLCVMAEIEGLRTPEDLGGFLLEKAREFYEIGDRFGDNAALLVAIAAYREALKEVTQERVPLDWATTQTNLGNALATLGERESGTVHLETAVAAFHSALQERTRELVPLAWAETKNNLGNALATLGERESGTERLEAAVAAFHSALQERTRERVPLAWAATQNNLGNALAALGERESGTEHLEGAIVAYHEALKEWSQERVPFDWAMTQNNLGNVLSTLGGRDDNTVRLEEAVVAYREALKEHTRERVPLAWAATQANLGVALAALGERESEIARLEEAVVAYREALKEHTRERVPLAWAATQANLGVALAALGERESEIARLDEAVVAYREALKEHTRERVPLAWAATQNNLGNALRSLGERENGTARLEDAVAAFRNALQERTRERVPLAWAATQNNLGNALTALGERENGTVRLEEAVAAYGAALLEWTRDNVPLEWSRGKHNLGYALSKLGERESGTARLDEAVVAFNDALKERSHRSVPLMWARSAGDLGSAMTLIAQRRNDLAMAEAALIRLDAAFTLFRDVRHVPDAANYGKRLQRARALVEHLRFT
ncbi:tetratricopeptide repeat protein [Methylocystis sp. SC2]|uniref:alpha/beta hydrolase n=1 Tax=Methylocystis sp. (strain SC2) TaxID=187303 RepID=UPI00027AE8D5|nr:tetratricopeptide repeat protein [Methylocystis sp. SC2]CCJ05574.1 Tetratricopeptide repeat domain protein [Methylocystis sp. SC2]